MSTEEIERRERKNAYMRATMISRDEVMRILSYNETTGVFTRKIYRGKYIAGEKSGTVEVTSGGKSYIRIRINGKSYRAHRLAWLVMKGEFPEHEIDHINGNGLDNRSENLRAVTHAENGKNQRKYNSNSSGCAGVSWYKLSNKWRARITINGRVIYLGLFDNLEDAVAARKAADITYNFHPNHGETRPL
jgi:hypothetical protein